MSDIGCNPTPMSFTGTDAMPKRRRSMMFALFMTVTAASSAAVDHVTHSAADTTSSGASSLAPVCLSISEDDVGEAPLSLIQMDATLTKYAGLPKEASVHADLVAAPTRHAPPKSNATRTEFPGQGHRKRRHHPTSYTVELQDETDTFEVERGRNITVANHSSDKSGEHAGTSKSLSVDSAAKKSANSSAVKGGIPKHEEDEVEAEEYRCGKVWNVIKHVRRHKSKRKKNPNHHDGFFNFFGSVVVYEWLTFALALAVFFPIFYALQEYPSTPRFHIFALLVWIGLGGIYNLAVWVRLGSDAGVMWFTGYLLEFIFSIENVFVFHIVVKAFRTPQRLTQKALFIVICCQIVFEMVFMMGLASRVRSFTALPYILGVWLLYVGYHASQDDGHDDFNIKESFIFRLSEAALGKRLMNSYDEQGSVLMLRGGKLCVTMLFPLICCLLAVDFLLEVDVTLTKIEELPNEYLAFTSSAVAAFAVPELFFVARDMFQRFHLLKYGVSFVLLFYGVQMLMHTVFVIPDLAGCGIVVVVMIICMLLSSLLGTCKEVDYEIRKMLKMPEPMPEPPCKEVK